VGKSNDDGQALCKECIVQGMMTTVIDISHDSSNKYRNRIQAVVEDV
jgi:tyrosine-protein phosphatase YwqE